MALTNAYITVNDLRDHLADDGARLDTSVLERAINAASRQVDTHCGRRFWRDATVTTRTFAVDDPLVAWVDDISTVTGLVIKSDDDLDGTFGTTWTSGQYQLQPINAAVVAGADTVTPWAYWQVVATDRGARAWPFAESRPVLSVTARFGWSSVPSEVELATALRAAALFRRKDAPFGVAGFGEFGAVRITRRDPDVEDLLAPYVRSRPRTLTYAPQRGSLFHGGRW